ncbi:DUF397 domain-containing protein [Dactylosporangium sp. AC04546]|uniref:DUF397 domain-containing protein n=1 Tax=Dactylosporangium sp. AC04546 TaxID=2862460 RepID=UPI001EDCB4CA|nr:DUF397 domain-containing protein [Dactylosporangium sp. AC04546]WVK81366.1 DUF397 domain-containing protein [Dactylosporangium sp. AC04546]
MAGDVRDGGWKVSSRCESTSCVEVRLEPDHVVVRASADEGAPRLVFLPGDWQAFVAMLKDRHSR